MSSPWFGVNRFWGWYPASWEGWVVLLTMATSTALTVYIVDSNSQSVSDTLLGSFPYVALIIAFTMFVAIIKGVTPEFGKDNKHKKNYSPDFPNAYLFLSLLSIPVIVYYILFKAYAGAAILLLVFLLLYTVYLRTKKAQKAS